MARLAAVVLGTPRAFVAIAGERTSLAGRRGGLEVAAQYVAGGREGEVLGDFYDVFPSVPGSWGMVVGDVCGRLRDLVAALGDMSAERIADAIQRAGLSFSGGQVSDDTVTLVLRIPRH